MCLLPPFFFCWVLIAMWEFLIYSEYFPLYILWISSTSCGLCFYFWFLYGVWLDRIEFCQITFLVSVKIIIGRGNGNPLQYSCPGNPMERGAWQGIVHGVNKESDTAEQLHKIIIWLFLKLLVWLIKCTELLKPLKFQGLIFYLFIHYLPMLYIAFLASVWVRLLVIFLSCFISFKVLWN